MRRLHVVPSVGSTNDEARTLAAEGAPDGTIVIAEGQTSGRGRFRRDWHSAEGLGLYLSALLRPQEPAELIGRYALAAAVAACAACRTIAGDGVRIKWPNDLIGGGRKIAGILAEVRSAPAGLELVVGIGVNVNHRHDDFPPALRGTAVSLRTLRGGAAVDRETVASALLSSLGAELADLRSGAWSRVAERFLRYAPAVSGARVRLATGAGGVTGGLDPSGALRIVTDDGIVLAHASESVSEWEA